MGEQRLPKQVRQLLKAARKAGWTYRTTKHGTTWLSPCGKYRVRVGGTVRDTRRLARNVRADLKRAGLDV